METKQNFLIPPHRKLTPEETKVLLEKYSIDSSNKLPKIKIKDPAINKIEDLKLGDIIEIKRKSFVGESRYYREVIE